MGTIPPRARFDFFLQLGYCRVRAVRSPSSILFDSQIEADTRAILEAVRRGGDAALCRLVAKFDGVQLRPSQLRVSDAEVRAAAKSVSKETKQAMEIAHANLQLFAQRQLRRNWSMKNKQGGRVGERFVPLRRVGIHIPGASAPLFSTVLHTVTLARAAGVPEIVVCNPCGPDGKLHPAVLHACQRTGATEIYRVGGAQAIAAMAFGTKMIRPVDKIFGPGNRWTITAKRLLFGHVGIDLLPGPSELLVIADGSADPEFVVADLLAQAEHGGEGERVWLLSLSPRVSKAVKQAMRGHPLARRCRLLCARSAAEAVATANQIAPEHIELLVRNPRRLLKQIYSAGAVFLGAYSPAVLGDYVAGPSHTLPTGGSGRAFSGLSADQFQRRISVTEYDRAALKKSLPFIEEFAAIEGLPEHARSARLRRGRGAAVRAVAGGPLLWQAVRSFS